MLLSLKQIPNETLVTALKTLKGKENTTQAQIIRYLSELDERKLFRDLGYSSLFTYCTEALGYSAGSAYTRVQAARCLKDNPQIYELIRDGKVSICSVAEIAKIKVQSVQAEIIQEAIGKSKEEVKLLTIPYLPTEEVSRETIKPKVVEVVVDMFNQVTDAESSLNQKETRFNFSVEVDSDFMSLYTEAKKLIGHLPAQEILRRALNEFINRKNAAPKRIVNNSNSDNSGRYISKQAKYEVKNRDDGQCTFVSADGRRCTEKHGLEYDHIQPYALGGDNSAENLRLVCRAHNQLYAEKVFGKFTVHAS